MANSRPPYRSSKPARQSRESSPSRTVPRWIAITGILGSLALALLGYLAEQRKGKIEARNAINDLLPKPIVLISQEADPIDPHDMAKAVKATDLLIEESPHEAAPRAVKSILALKAGNNQSAKNLAQEALEIDPGLPSALNTKALVTARSGNLAEAKIGFEHARDSAEQRNLLLERDVAKLNLSMTLAGMGALDEARKELEGPLSDPMTQAIAYNTLGNILILESRLAEASEAYLIASKDESFIGAAQNLACSYKLQGRMKEYNRRLVKLRELGASEPSCDTRKDFSPDVGLKGSMAFWRIERDF